jgi:hypothetical protein
VLERLQAFAGTEEVDDEERVGGIEVGIIWKAMVRL